MCFLSTFLLPPRTNYSFRICIWYYQSTPDTAKVLGAFYQQAVVSYLLRKWIEAALVENNYRTEGIKYQAKSMVSCSQAALITQQLSIINKSGTLFSCRDVFTNWRH